MRNIILQSGLAALLVAQLAALMVLPAAASEHVVTASQRPDLKAVFGQIESRDVVPARARIGGTIVSLAVEEGSAVQAGDVIATVVDDKLALQLSAVDARIKALAAERDNARVELDRAVKLLQTGVVPKTKVDQLQTQYDVLVNQMAAAMADRSVLEQQQSEGNVLAPSPGRVLTVPVTKGSVIMPGEPVARIAGGGYFIRLSLPERHAAHIRQGDEVIVGSRGMTDLGGKAPLGHGHIVKVYPEIEGGRVLADVEVEGLGDFFVGERTRVWVAVDTRTVLAVPAEAMTTRHGIDYVAVASADGEVDIPVIVGQSFEDGGTAFIEILSGLAAGDKVIVP
jgi:RND family efflux transporter MFP subunit